MAQTDSDLVRLAAEGDQQAWEELTARHIRLIWSIPVGLGLSDADAKDVVQLTWLRLVGAIDSIRDPDRIGSWLATTAKRETWALLKSRSRVVPVGASGSLLEDAKTSIGVDDDFDAGLPDPVVVEALRRLGDRCRTLLLMLSASPPATYEDAAEQLGLSVGSIGATRRRCLDTLEANYRQLLSEEW